MTNFDEKAATWDQNLQTVERASAIAAAMQRRLPSKGRLNLCFGNGSVTADQELYGVDPN